MSTQKLIGPAALVGGLLVASLSGQAQAADELVVYGAPTRVVVGPGQQVYRATVEEYIRSFNRELRATIEADLKRELAPPKVELASITVPTRG
jgi:hypothetical protein